MMNRTAAVAALSFALLGGCGQSESSAPSPAGSSSPNNTSAGGSAATPPSKYGTPEMAAKTFLAACAAGDWKAVGESCSKTPGRIDEIREGRLAEGERRMFKDVLGAAKLGEATKGADGKTAEVKFKAMKGTEEVDGVLKFELVGTDWMLTDVK